VQVLAAERGADVTQAIKYQTTTVAAERSGNEIMALVRKYGGTRFEQMWGEAGELVGIRFAIRTDAGEVPVSMKARTERIREVLLKSRRRVTTRQREELTALAHRVAWRHLKDLTEQLLLAVELGLQDVGAAFMAHIEVWDDAEGETVTMAEYLQRRAVLEPGDRGVRLLESGEAPRVLSLSAGRSVG
jgi:hypothetical protein